MVGVSDERSLSTVTLVLSGGHLLRLSGDVDVELLIRHLESSEDEKGVIEIASSRNERLILRRNALLGVVVGREDAEMAVIDQPIAVPFHRIENFLSPEEHQAVLNRALSRETEFTPSSVTTGDQNVRKSVVLTNDDMIEPMFRAKIISVIPALTEFSSLMFAQSVKAENIECQITAHLDGGFFQIHNDSGGEKMERRIITFVYYFASRPNAFLGGELKIYAPDGPENGRRANFTLAPPADNSIVFFPSDVMHEVLPTYVPSKQFSDSRFTVNGWIQRG
jgi:Rps23 Pro-64 3,4-dihydroxylase Tpa1-like proline 4-hydroxylase